MPLVATFFIFYMSVSAVCSVSEAAFKFKKFLILQHLEKKGSVIYHLLVFFLSAILLLVTKHGIELALQLQNIIDFTKK